MGDGDSTNQDLKRVTGLLLRSCRIGNTFDRYDKYPRYVVLQSNQIFQSLVSIYEFLFSSEWIYLGPFMEAFSVPDGVSPQSYLARVYISAWFHDSYCVVRKIIDLTCSSVIFIEKFRHQEIRFLGEYDAFLSLLSDSLRPTAVAHTPESSLYIPLLHSDPDWNSDNPFDITGYVIDTVVLHNLMNEMKRRKCWKIVPVSSRTSGRPSWLFDWHENRHALAWFPREGNYTDDDVTIAYIIGVACTSNLAPRDVDDWRYGNGPPPEPPYQGLNRVEDRRFFGAYEVRTIEAVTVDPAALSLETDGSRRRKLRTGATSGSSGTTTMIEVQGFPKYRIIDWCYYSRVTSKSELATRLEALSILCFK